MNNFRKITGIGATALIVTTIVMALLMSAGGAAGAKNVNVTKSWVFPENVDDEEATYYEFQVTFDELEDDDVEDVGYGTNYEGKVVFHLPDGFKHTRITDLNGDDNWGVTVADGDTGSGSVTVDNVVTMDENITIWLNDDDDGNDAEEVSVFVRFKTTPSNTITKDTPLDVTAEIVDYDGADTIAETIGTITVFENGPVVRYRSDGTSTDEYSAIQNAVDEASAGQTIKVYDYYDSRAELLYNDQPGHREFPIVLDNDNLTIMAMSGQTPVIDASWAGSTVYSGTGVYAIDTNSKENITIDGLKIIGGVDEDVIYAGDVSAGLFTVKNCWIHVDENTLPAGETSGIYTVDNTHVKNCKIKSVGDNDAVGIWLGAGADGSVIEDSSFDPLFDGVYAWNVSDITIENNIFTDITFAGVEIDTNTSVSGITINKNTFNGDNNAIFLQDQAGSSITAHVEYNNFNSGVDNYAIWGWPNDGSGSITVEAENNWWSSIKGPVVKTSKNRPAVSENYLDSIDVTPWLDAPYPDGKTVAPVQFDKMYYTLSETPIVKAYDGPSNADSTVAENIVVDIESVNAGDIENIKLTETGKNTGVFEGELTLSSVTDNLENLLVNLNDKIRNVSGSDNSSLTWDEYANQYPYEEKIAYIDNIAPIMKGLTVENMKYGVIATNDNTFVRRNQKFTVIFSDNYADNVMIEFDGMEFADEDWNLSPGSGENVEVSFTRWTDMYGDGELTATATVTDMAGNSSTIDNVVIVDTTAPDVDPESMHVGVGPEKENYDLTFEADITDNVLAGIPGSGIDMVEIDASSVGGADNVQMTDPDNDGVYTAEDVTVQLEMGNIYELPVTATDRLELSTTENLILTTVPDNEAPTIENLWIDYGSVLDEAKPGDWITVNAIVTDNVIVDEVMLNAENIGLGTSIEMDHIEDNHYAENLMVPETFDNYGMQQVTVTATDTVNNTATASTDANIVSYYTRFNIHLSEGWNLISLPIIPENTEPEAVLAGFGDSIDNVVSVWGYDTLDGQWMTYTPGVPMPPTFPTLQAMEDGKAYWIKMNEAATLEVRGREMPVGQGGVTPPTYELHTGWNLVGFTSISQKSRDAYLGMIKNQVTGMTVFGYDTNKGLYTVGPSTMLTPGQGYWVFVTEKAAFTAW